MSLDQGESWAGKEAADRGRGGRSGLKKDAAGGGKKWQIIFGTWYRLGLY